jgi:hypothetical protein
MGSAITQDLGISKRRIVRCPDALKQTRRDRSMDVSRNILLSAIGLWRLRSINQSCIDPLLRGGYSVPNPKFPLVGSEIVHPHRVMPPP